MLYSHRQHLKERTYVYTAPIYREAASPQLASFSFLGAVMTFKSRSGRAGCLNVPVKEGRREEEDEEIR